MFTESFLVHDEQEETQVANRAVSGWQQMGLNAASDKESAGCLRRNWGLAQAVPFCLIAVYSREVDIRSAATLVVFDLKE